MCLMKPDGSVNILYSYSFMNELFHRTVQENYLSQAIWYISVIKANHMPLSHVCLLRVFDLIEDEGHAELDATMLFLEAMAAGIEIKQVIINKYLSEMVNRKEYDECVSVINDAITQNPMKLSEIPFQTLTSIFYNSDRAQEIESIISSLINEENVIDMMSKIESKYFMKFLINLMNRQMFRILEIVFEYHDKNEMGNPLAVSSAFIKDIFGQLEKSGNNAATPFAYHLFMYGSKHLVMYQLKSDFLEKGMGRIYLNQCETKLEIMFTVLRAFEYIYKSPWGVYENLKQFNILCGKMWMGHQEDGMYIAKQMCRFLDGCYNPPIRMDKTRVDAKTKVNDWK